MCGKSGRGFRFKGTRFKTWQLLELTAVRLRALFIRWSETGPVVSRGLGCFLVYFSLWLSILRFGHPMHAPVECLKTYEGTSLCGRFSRGWRTRCRMSGGCFQGYRTVLSSSRAGAGFHSASLDTSGVGLASSRPSPSLGTQIPPVVELYFAIYFV